MIIRVEINEEETVALANVRRAIKLLDKFNKQTVFLPSARAAAAVHQTMIQSLLIKLGMEEKTGVGVVEKHKVAGGYPFTYLC